ncbi:hypothetical protein PFISCL1PPCAC_20659 [Pristionchus fissidentatus]|uniref:Ribosomal protein n=1 Tax=Pristionchus fissidentatus TaxID=1538716 RepID=A0AAV5WBY0_9BILA|nr:hypothetical protein PFISCL1PPCAC_20659 [Pristionchus fissidentatus]
MQQRLVVTRVVGDVTANLVSELVPPLGDVDSRVAHLLRRRDVHHIAHSSRSGISVRRMHNRPSAQLARLLVRHLRLVVRVQDTVGVEGSGSDGARLEKGAVALRVHHEDLGTALVVAGHHRTDRESLSLVSVQHVGKVLGGGGDSDLGTLAQLEHVAVFVDGSAPELAVGGSSGHRGHHVVSHVQDLHHRLGRYVLSSRGARVDGNDDSSHILLSQRLVDERKRRRSL